MEGITTLSRILSGPVHTSMKKGVALYREEGIDDMFYSQARFWKKYKAHIPSCHKKQCTTSQDQMERNPCHSQNLEREPEKMLQWDNTQGLAAFGNVV